MVGATPAHVGRLLPHDALTAWSFEPTVVVPLAVAALLYERGRERRPHDRRHLAFVLCLTTVAVALMSPIDAISGVLASAHMVQHVLLLVVAAPLLAYAAPGASLARGAPRPLRRNLDAIRRASGLSATRLRRLRSPVARWLLLVVVVWMWHAAALYTTALEHHAVHILQHGSFLVVGYLVWVPVLGPARARTEPVAAVGLVFAVGLQNVVLSLLLTFSTEPWYRPYVGTAPDWGLDALTDQHLAGVIMWVPVGLIHAVIALVYLGSWLNTAAEPSRSTDPHTAATTTGRS